MEYINLWTNSFKNPPGCSEEISAEFFEETLVDILKVSLETCSVVLI